MAEADSDVRRRIAAYVANSLLGDRAAVGKVTGTLFDGRRDVFAAAGYPDVLTFDDYYGAYKRQDIARRVVVAKPAETWRLQPQVLDGATVEKGRDNTAFAKALQSLAEGSDLTDIEDARLNLWQALHRLDRVAGIGRYGVLYLGVRDGKDPTEPLLRGAASGVKDLLYLSVFNEKGAVIDTLNDDPSSPRFGLPEYYRLTVKAGDGLATREMRAHWSRCVHVAEDVDDDDLYGTPRLEACFNRTLDLLKVTAASSEAAWKLSDPGYSITANEGKRLPVDAAQLEALQAQIEDYIDGLTRYLLLEGLETTPMTGSIQDPSGLITITVALISAATGIPQRILLGSERGNLASEQDERNWATQIETRQVNHVEPAIILPVIGRLIYAGVLPAPSSGKVAVKWSPLLESDRKAEAETAKAAAEALNAVKAKVDPVKFAAVYLPEIPADAIEEAPEPPPVPIMPPPGAPGAEQGVPGADGQIDGEDTPSSAEAPEDGEDGTPTANVGARLLMAQDEAGNWYYAYP